MSYIDKVLQPNEGVRFQTTISWTVMVPGLVLLLAAIAVTAAVQAFFGAPIPTLVALVVLCLPALFVLARAWFRRSVTEIVVTNMRVVFKSGFLSRRTIEMNMDKVESVDVDQSILGRIFNYGEVLVRGTGSGFEPLTMVDNPLALRNQITVTHGAQPAP